MTRQRERGSALVVAIAVVLVVSAMAVGLIRLGTAETAGATAGARQQALSACADAASKLLMSKFHALGMNPVSIQALNVPIDGTNGVTMAVGGHVDTAGVQVAQVTLLPDTALGQAGIKGDITNRLKLTGNGNALKVVVHCQDHGNAGDPLSGRQLEIEMGVRFGL